MFRLAIIALVAGGASLPAMANQPSSPSKEAPSAHKVRKSQHRVRKSQLSAAPAAEPATLPPAPPPMAVVSYQDGLLTISAQNVTLQEIMDRVRESTGASVEVPALSERVTVHLGPQPPGAVIAALLEGSHLNYVIMGGVDQYALKAIWITREAAAEPDPAPPVPSLATLEAQQAAAAEARALFIAQTGGDEGVWDNAPETVPAPQRPH